MLVEPPGALVPARPGLSALRVDGVRQAAAAAALVLAVLSRGDALVLAGLLVAAGWRPIAAIAVVPAMVAASWRWGSTALEALAGAQAVLGPAGLVGSTRAAASSWLAAAALLLAAPRAHRAWRPQPLAGTGPTRSAIPLTAERAAPGASMGAFLRPTAGRLGGASARFGGPAGLVLAGATGATAAAVVAGPAPGGQLWVRALASVAGIVVALAVGRVRDRRTGAPPVLDGLAAVCGVLALVAVSGGAPAWQGTVDVSALRTGLVLALAVGATVLVGSAAVRALGARAQ